MTASRRSASSPPVNDAAGATLTVITLNFFIFLVKNKFEAWEPAEGLVPGARVASSGGCCNVQR